MTVNEEKEKAISGFVKDAEIKASSIYHKGYCNGFKAGVKEGRESVWKAIRNMADMPYEDFKKIYGDWSLTDVIRNMTVDGAMELLEAFNAKNFEVGDLVKDENGLRAIITNTDTHIHLLYIDNGKTRKAPKDANLVRIAKCEQGTILDDGMRFKFRSL